MDLNASVPRKNPVVAVLLAIVLGPLGMFYSTITGALTMLSVVILSTVGAYVYLVRRMGSPSDLNWEFFFSPDGLLTYQLALWALGLILYAICIFWALIAAQSHNRRILVWDDELEAGSADWNLLPERTTMPPGSTNAGAHMELECPQCGKTSKVADVGKFCKECGGQMQPG